MSKLFLTIVNMSISASWLVLAVLIFRFFLKKAPRWVNVLLWGIVAVRLAFPFSIESVLSLIPSAETVPVDIEMAAQPVIDSGVAAINSVVNPALSSFAMPQDAATGANPLQIWIPICSIVWLVGVAALFMYTAVSCWKLRQKVDTAVRCRDNIFQSENVGSPFVLGVIRPKIYLPFKIDAQDLEYVAAHEQAHIRRKDHWWKLLGFILLTIHWFNPLIWLAYVLLCRDIELACDEKAIRKLDNEQRAYYTQALVACSVSRRMIAACPLAFGEVGVKERVKSIMNYKKPAFWMVVMAVSACIVVAVCFLTNPISGSDDTLEEKYYLLIGTEGVLDIEVSTPNTSGGCRNADNSPFKKGEKVWLEQLNSDSDLRGVTIIALDTEGSVIYTFAVPENATDDEIARLVSGDSWLMAPAIADTQSSETFGNTNAEKHSGFHQKDYEAKEKTDSTVCVEAENVETPISDEDARDDAIFQIVFEAQILEIHDGYFLVKPESGLDANSADQIQIPVKNVNPALEAQAGDIIKIACSGEIIETYPARLTEVYSVAVVDKADDAENQSEQPVKFELTEDMAGLPGDWTLDVTYTENCNSGISIREIIGTSLDDQDASLHLSDNGTFEYSMGALTGKGVWYPNGDTGRYVAELVVYPEERDEILMFYEFRETPDGGSYIVLDYEEYSLYWMRSAETYR